MNALLARILGSHKARTMLATYGKSSWTVFKRISARDLRRWVLKDDMALGDAPGRMTDSLGTTSWIMKRIVASDVSKRATGAAIKRSGLDVRWGESTAKQMMDVRKAQTARKLEQHIMDLKAEEYIRKQYPSLDVLTGELTERSTLSQGIRDIARWAQLTALAPGKTSQVYANQVIAGAGIQFAVSKMMNLVNEHPEISGAVWSSPFMNNLDEVGLGSGSINDMFGAVELGIQAFNMLTLVKTGGVFRGRYHRVNRLAFLNAAGQAAKMRSTKPLAQYGTVAGAGRLTGSLGMRQLLLLTGQDERNRDAYRKRNSSGSGKTITIQVRSYTRDGHTVKAHTREVEAYY